MSDTVSPVKKVAWLEIDLTDTKPTGLICYGISGNEIYQPFDMLISRAKTISEYMGEILDKGDFSHLSDIYDGMMKWQRRAIKASLGAD